MLYTKIEELAYELYKLDWMRRISVDRQMDAVKDYYGYLTGDDTDQSLTDYLEEFGYDGEFYACFDEFLENEYLDKEYMKALLNDEAYMFYLSDLSISFIEKEEEKFEDTNPFIGSTYVPVYMVKDEQEYFVVNKDINHSDIAYENRYLTLAKEQLMKNGGAWFSFYSAGYNDPIEMIEEVHKRGFHFTEQTTYTWNKKQNCFDFSGNQEEVSAAFSFRIYDKKYAEQIQRKMLDYHLFPIPKTTNV